MLTYKSFSVVPVSNGRFYFSHWTFDKKELCLEVCLNGLCVALYDENQNLIGKKVCTNIPDPLADNGNKVFEKALELANYKLECLSTIK